MNEIITADYFPGQDCDCEARSSYECGCGADWTPIEVYKLREDAKQLAERLTALELRSTSELARLEKERDDAREDLEEETKFHHRTHIELIQTQCKLLDMEMQRDEAREKVEQQRKEIVRLNGATNHAGGTPLKIALIERDEARDAIVGWENKWKCAVDMAARAELERDEARGALMRIEDLFIDGEDIYADRESMGMIARNALEEIK
jgi:hypothetical protein